MSEELDKLIGISHGKQFTDYGRIDRCVREFAALPWEKLDAGGRFYEAFEDFPEEYGFAGEKMEHLTYLGLIALTCAPVAGEKSFFPGDGDLRSDRTLFLCRINVLRRMFFQSVRCVPEAALLGNVNVRSLSGYIRAEAAGKDPVWMPDGTTADSWFDRVFTAAKAAGVCEIGEMTLLQVITCLSEILVSPWFPWKPVREYQKQHESCMEAVILLLISDFRLLYPDAFITADLVRKLNASGAQQVEEPEPQPGSPSL